MRMPLYKRMDLVWWSAFLFAITVFVWATIYGAIRLVHRDWFWMVVAWGCAAYNLNSLRVIWRYR